MKIFFFGLACIALALFLAKLKKGKPTAKIEYKKKALMTKNEQPMFWRLVETFPQSSYVVLSQVSFNAVLDNANGGFRGTFSQKVADFVLTDRAFNVLAFIELDDSSHKGKEASDAKRDSMLKSAGYNVLRYKRVPDSTTLRADLAKL